jgi:hypothetical protein
MQDSHKKLQNLMRFANEGRTVKDAYPPNVSKLNDNMLKMASAGNFSLLNNTKTNSDTSDAAANRCRTYQGITGLRQLQIDQGNRTYYEPGCGWRYKASTGTAPQISQGALGTGDGPTFGQAGSTDEVTGGTQWLWDLHDAEKTISQAICQSASRCSQLALLGNFADQCGWCKTTNTAIPIITAAGQTIARYRKDTVMGCASKDIQTAGNCSASASESFRNQREGFATLDSLDECDVSPLSRDCVIQAARTAGCSDEGSLIHSLQGASTGDYDTQLQSTPVYQAYKSVALPSITKQTLKDGSVGLSTALNDFYGLIGNMGSSNKKLAVSARDLCIKAGTYDSYNFCAEMTPNTIIDQTNMICVQNDWKSRGGTEQGASYPTLAKWNGKSWSMYDSSTNLILKNLTVNKSKEGFIDKAANDKAVSAKAANAKALMDLMGVDSFGSPATLPMVDVTRGAETVWFDFSSGSVVILRSYIAGVPYFSDRGYTSKYGLNTPSGKAYTSAFEIRKPMDDSIRFEVITSDGFIISKNQNPFEGTAYSRNDWGGWLKQPATKYLSAPYPIDSDDRKTNTFVSKWFSVDNTPTSQLNIIGNGRKVQADQYTDMYITQEPYAPWMQYEVCTRPNFQVTATGFFEKRWNGPCAYSYQNGSPFPSFDVMAKSVVIQSDGKSESLPGGKGYMSFNAGSQWHTQAYFHFTAFKSISLLIRPIANISPNNSAPIFTHRSASASQGQSKGYNLFLRNNNGVYVIGLNDSVKNITMNVWNLVVIQYVGDQNGVRAFNFSVDTLDSLSLSKKQNQQVFVDSLTANQQSFTSVIAGAPGDTLANSGRLALGMPDGSTTQSFTGDVAWVHGFRDYISTVDMLAKEVAQTWISRWPRSNL